MSHATAAMLRRSFYAVGLALGVILILWGGRIVLVPLSLAVLLAFVLTPVVDWLNRRGMPRKPSVALVAFLTLLLLTGAGYVVTLQLTGLAAQFRAHGDEYRQNVADKFAPVLELLESARKVEDMSKDVPGVKEGQEQKLPPTPVVVESHGFGMLSWLPAVVWPVVEVGGETLLVVVLAIFILLWRENLRDRLLSLLGPRHIAGSTRALNDTARRVSRYLLLLACINGMVGLAVGLGLYFIGVPYAVLWGVLVAALRFIPYIGVWVAAALPFGLSLAIFPNWTPALLVLGLFLTIELVVANAVEPLLFGHGTGVAPLPLLLAAVFWAWLWGPAGLLLSTPLTVCLVVLGRHVPALRMLDILLGAQPTLDPPARLYQRLLAGDVDEASGVLQERLDHQPLEEVCDELVLPALLRARVEREDGNLNADEERAVLRGTRLLIRSVLAPDVSDVTPGRVAELVGPPLRVLGCPARGAADAIALRMLGLALHSSGCELKLVTAERVVAEARALAQPGRPAVVCIGTLPPGGLANAAHLCRRLRTRVPGVRVIIGRWGSTDEAGASDARLRNVGAESVGATLRETLALILAALGLPPQVAAPPRPATPAAASTAATAAVDAAKS